MQQRRLERPRIFKNLSLSLKQPEASAKQPEDVAEAPLFQSRDRKCPEGVFNRDCSNGCTAVERRALGLKSIFKEKEARGSGSLVIGSRLHHSGIGGAVKRKFDFSACRKTHCRRCLRLCNRGQTCPQGNFFCTDCWHLWRKMVDIENLPQSIDSAKVLADDDAYIFLQPGRLQQQPQTLQQQPQQQLHLMQNGVKKLRRDGALRDISSAFSNQSQQQQKQQLQQHCRECLRFGNRGTLCPQEDFYYTDCWHLRKIWDIGNLPQSISSAKVLADDGQIFSQTVRLQQPPKPQQPQQIHLTQNDIQKLRGEIEKLRGEQQQQRNLPLRQQLQQKQCQQNLLANGVAPALDEIDQELVSKQAEQLSFTEFKIVD
eukprot:TRINITY_DN8866_c1_g1_i1.p1 TRINITY_DN8866_c1_g1~~TRINITY_DN8866_c1_g1_i1.p1  ORF type:complete len:372 (+),score=73.70 TRINITY_DN8866_c1_g1_i1:24-1139(+)